MAVTRYPVGLIRTPENITTRSFWLCSTAADLPASGQFIGDYALALDTSGFYLADTPTSWVAVSAGGGAHPDLAAHDALGLFTDAEEAAHLAALDPHSQYELDANKDVAFGYPSLNAAAKVPITEIPFSTAGLVDVAATADGGVALTVPLTDHRHAHGSGYLPDAHHAKSHVHFGDGSGTVDYSSLSGVPATFPATAHNLFSVTHGDTTGAASPVDGDIIIGNATPRWSKLAISVPAANVRNVLAIDNGELRPSWKAALDATAPTDSAVGDVAGSGTSLLFAHRDHLHGREAVATNGQNIHDELAAALARRTDIYFMGNGVFAQDAGGRTEIVIPAGVYDAIVDSTDTNAADKSTCFSTLQAAITAGAKTIAVKNCADVTTISITGSDAVTSIVGVNAQVASIPVSIFCTKADVYFAFLEFASQQLIMTGARDIAFACLFTGNITAGTALINNASNITAAATSIAFDGGLNGGMQPAVTGTHGYAKIENEIIAFSGGGGGVSGTLTCTSAAIGRGINETLAESHLDNTLITCISRGNLYIDGQDIEVTACRFVACSNPLLPAMFLGQNADSAKITTCSFLSNTCYTNVMIGSNNASPNAPTNVTWSDCKFRGNSTVGMQVEFMNSENSATNEVRFWRFAACTFSQVDSGAIRFNSGLGEVAGGVISGGSAAAPMNTQTAALNCAATAMTAQITRVGQVATVTATAHGYVTGDWITTQGATQPEYNITAQITKIDANSYSYIVAGAPATPSTGAPTRQYSGLLATDNYLYYKTLAGTGTLATKGQLRIGNEDIYFGNRTAVGATSSAIRFDSCRRGQNQTTAAANVDGATITNDSQRAFLWSGAGTVLQATGNAVNGVVIDSVRVITAESSGNGIGMGPVVFGNNLFARWKTMYLGTSYLLEGNLIVPTGAGTVDFRSTTGGSILGGRAASMSFVNMDATTNVQIGSGVVPTTIASLNMLPGGRQFSLGRTAGDLTCLTVPMTNRTGANSVAGDVVTIQLITNDYSFVKAAGLASTAVCGVVVQNGIADGAPVLIAIAGLATVTCTTAGAVARGDILQTSATAGQAQTVVSPAVGTGFGKALTAKAALAAGSVVALLMSC